MNIRTMLETIESHDFAAEINLASSLRTAAAALLHSHAFLELLDQVQDADVAYDVLYRTLELTRRTVDVRYENPNDVALFAYQFALSETSAALALIAASAVSQVPSLWWASTFAAEIIDNRAATNSSAGATSSDSGLATDVVDRVFVADTRWLFSPPSRLVEFFVRSPLGYADVFVSHISDPEWKDMADDTHDVPLSIA